MVEADDRAQAPDFPARNTLDAQSARLYLEEAMRDMFDLLDEDVEAVAADLFEPEERMLALFAGHPSTPRHFLACSERSVILFKRDRDGALSMRIIPLAEIEAIDLRPLAVGRTGALVLRTVSTSAGPPFTFPLETHFAYYRVVALTRLLRRLQSGEPIDAALAELKLEACVARDLFVGNGSEPQGVPPAQTGPAPAASHALPGEASGSPGEPAETAGGEPFADEERDEVGFESQVATEVPPHVEEAAEQLAAEAAPAGEAPAAELAVAPLASEPAPFAQGAANEPDAEPALDGAAVNEGPAEPDGAPAPAADPTELSTGAVATSTPGAEPSREGASSGKRGAELDGFAAPAATDAAGEFHEHLPAEEEPVAASATRAAEFEEAEPDADMVSSAATPFRAPVKAVSDVNLPTLSDKQLRGRLKMKELAAEEEKRAGESSATAAEGAAPAEARASSPEPPTAANDLQASAPAPPGGDTPAHAATGGETEPGESASSPQTVASTFLHGEDDGPPQPSKLVSDVALASFDPEKARRSKSRLKIRKDEAQDNDNEPAGSGNGNGTTRASNPADTGGEEESAPAHNRPVATSGGSRSTDEPAKRRTSSAARRTQRSESGEKPSRKSRAGGSSAEASEKKGIDPALKREPWFLYRGAAQHGPYPFEQLREWLRAGKLGASEFIRSRSMTQWIRVHQAFDD